MSATCDWYILVGEDAISSARMKVAREEEANMFHTGANVPVTQLKSIT